MGLKLRTPVLCRREFADRLQSGFPLEARVGGASLKRVEPRTPCYPVRQRGPGTMFFGETLSLGGSRVRSGHRACRLYVLKLFLHSLAQQWNLLQVCVVKLFP